VNFELFSILYFSQIIPQPRAKAVAVTSQHGPRIDKLHVVCRMCMRVPQRGPELVSITPYSAEVETLIASSGPLVSHVYLVDRVDELHVRTGLMNYTCILLLLRHMYPPPAYGVDELHMYPPPPQTHVSSSCVRG
jgi:hypothetical protein